ncbi:MAG: argininosuccinate lyase, partial [Candidatus Omnitrophica bacterium]|nr:argininosuccinate lyase [Candidatus Omnitrophota bacterium]
MAKKLWGGRFEKEIDKDFFEFQKSIGYDYKLAKYDIVHSLLHVVTLGLGKILSEPEKDKLLHVLKEIR